MHEVSAPSDESDSEPEDTSSQGRREPLTIEVAYSRVRLKSSAAIGAFTIIKILPHIAK